MSMKNAGSVVTTIILYFFIKGSK